VGCVGLAAKALWHQATLQWSQAKRAVFARELVHEARIRPSG
jgi:hypothetical protein